MSIDAEVFIVDRVVRTPGKPAVFTLRNEFWLLKSLDDATEFVRLSGNPVTFVVRNSAIEAAERKAYELPYAGLIVPAAKQTKRGLTWSIECTGRHGCGIVSRQTTQAYAFDSYKAHLLDRHEPSLIPIKEQTCR